MQTHPRLHPTLQRSARTAIAALALVSASACQDEEASHDDREHDAGTQMPEDGGREAGSDAGSPKETPLHLVHSATQNADGTRLNYFSLTPSLTEDTQLDYARSLEVPGRARLYAQPGLGYFAIGDSEALSLTRYTLTEEGEIEPGDSLSFMQLGVSSMAARAVHFVSETKAYYKDAGEGQVIVWNPKKMEIVDTLELPDEALKDDRLTSLSDWVAHDGQAYFAVSWTTQDYDRVDPGTLLVRIDTDTDELTVTEDDRCRGLSKTASYDGALYFFSSVINAFGHAVYPDEGGQAACALRILEGETDFDPDYVGDVASAFDASQAATVIDVTSDGTAWVQVADLEVAPTEPGSTYSEWYAEGWSWYRLPIDTLEDPKSVEGEPGAYSGFTATEEAHFFIAQSEADYSKTTLVDLSGKQPKDGLSFPGFALGVAQVR